MWQPKDPSGQFPTWPVPGVPAFAALLALVLPKVPSKSWRVTSECVTCRCCWLSALFRASPCRARNNRRASVNFVIVIALRFSTAWRDRGRQCAMPALISSSPQPSAMADMRKATTYGGDPSGHEHSQVCEAQLAYPSRRPGRPHRPRAEIEGAWCTGTGGKPYTCAVLKDLVGEAPPS